MNSNISIIIVTYNSELTIKQCLESLLKFSPASQIVIVDNFSKDKTREIIKSFKIGVKLIESGLNLGFAKACNLAEKEATGDYLVFLNPDTVILEAGSLERLVKALEDNQQLGLVGPKLVYEDGSAQKTVRKLPTLAGAFKEYILGKKGEYDFYQPESLDLCKVESIVGACIVVKKQFFESIGGFNEKYFLYFEDLDLCRSIIKSGFKIGYFPGVKVEHMVGASGHGVPTNSLATASEKIYFGTIRFLLVELIFTINRIKNKLRSV